MVGGRTLGQVRALLLSGCLECNRWEVVSKVLEPCLDVLSRDKIWGGSRDQDRGQGKADCSLLTDLVEHKNDLLALPRHDFSLSSCASASQWVACVQHLENDVSEIKHFSELSHVSFQRVVFAPRDCCVLESRCNYRCM